MPEIYLLETEDKNGDPIEIEKDVYRGDYLSCREAKSWKHDVQKRQHWQVCLRRCDQKKNCMAWEIFVEDHPELFKKTIRQRRRK